MNRETAFEFLTELDDRFIAEAVRYQPEASVAAPERKHHMKIKRIVTFALAAVLLLALGVTAFAAYSKVGTPEAAEKTALEQIEVWKEMGLLSQDVSFEGKAKAVYEFEEKRGDEAWYGRIFKHCYEVRWYGEGPYSCNLRVDTLTGKITAATIDADAPADAVPVREETFTGENGQPVTWYFYDNFEDLFPADMTVDRFCSLLAEYWGFSGYRLADTDAGSFYNQHWDAIDGSTLLKDLNSDTSENYYLTVFFEGDQDGAPMYVELSQFPGYVTMIVGTNHAVG